MVVVGVACDGDNKHDVDDNNVTYYSHAVAVAVPSYDKILLQSSFLVIIVIINININVAALI